MTVSGEDKTSGSKNMITITNNKGRISKAEIDRLVREAEEYKAADDEYKSKVEARNSFENYTYEIRKYIDNSREKLALDDKKKMEDALDHAIQWLDNNELPDVDDINNMWKALESACNPTTMSGGAEPEIEKTSKTELAAKGIKLVAAGVSLFSSLGLI
ncbi:heat shock 70 kDa protein-like [Papaver somniferum]|uniref:heat shock 70 kDa protein-like n=1 Tax=Papaver somniferum TaxID=3469 RepID=UPI000E7020C1|nr:heat shock 70 kDa protein-like [Papaver somniferum]